MLFLMFRIGEDRYVIDAGQIEQVLPLMDCKFLPGAPPGVVGAINYHGDPTPLIDLTMLALGRPSSAAMSTRILLVRYPDDRGGYHRLALCAERVNATLHRDADAFVATGVEAGTPPYLGPVASDAEGMVQWVQPQALLSDSVREVLFKQAGALAC